MEFIAAILIISFIWGIYSGLEGSSWQITVPVLVLGAPILLGYMYGPNFEGSMLENAIRYYKIGWDIAWENFKSLILNSSD